MLSLCKKIYYASKYIHVFYLRLVGMLDIYHYIWHDHYSPFAKKKIPILLSMFYVSYLLVSTAIIYQLLDNVLALIEGNYTAMIMFELIILPWIVFYLQTSLLYYFKRYLVYFANHILAKYRFQAAILDVTLLSYIYLRFSDLPNRLLIASIILVVIAAYIYCITLYSQKQAIKLAQAEQLQNLIEYTARSKSCMINCAASNMTTKIFCFP